MMNYWNNLSTVSGLPDRGWGMLRNGQYPFGGMMGYAYAGNNGLFVITAVMHVVTWILLLVLLAAVIRYIWKKGGK